MNIKQLIITKRIIIIDTIIMVLCCILLGLFMGLNF